MSSFSPGPSNGANLRPVVDGSWGLRLGLGIIAFALTVFILVLVALGIWREQVGSKGSHASASLDVRPRSLSFGTVEVGAEISPQEVTLVSTGEEPVELGEITIDGPNRDDFEADRKCSEMTLRTDRRCTVSVTFSPATDRKSGARLVIDRKVGGSKTVQLSGTGATPHARLSPLVMKVSAQMGETVTRRFIFENTGTASLKVYSVTLDAKYGFFSIADDACSNIGLEPEASCSIEVTITPTSDCESEDELVIKHDAPGSLSRARLDGTTRSLPCTGNTTMLPSTTESQYSPSTASPVP